MATSLLNPSFGSNGVAVGAVDTGSQLSNVTATAVQADGKVVVAGTYSTGNPNASPQTYPLLAVARYNANGTVDTTFGTNGQLNVPLPSGALGIITAPHNIVVGSNGSITLAASVAVPVSTTTGVVTLQDGLVVRLTSAGALDPTFGKQGEFLTAPTVGGVSAVAVLSDGRVLAAGGSTASDQLRVIRLTAAGAADTTFNSSGTANVSLAAGTTGIVSSVAAGVAVSPSGQIYVASQANTLVNFTTPGTAALLTRINDNGTADTTYGSFGTNRNVGLGFVGDMAVQSSGNVVLAGGTGATAAGSGSLALVRLLPSGAVDTTFAGLGQASSPTPIVAGAAFSSIAVGADGSITAAGATSRGPNTVGVVDRFTANGVLDATFGKNGQYSYVFNPPAGYAQSFAEAPASVALGSGSIVVAGQLSTSSTSRQSYVASLRPAVSLSPSNRSVANDYANTGRSDLAIQIASGSFAYSPTNGSSSGKLVQFGGPGVLATVPAPGDYDGDGIADIAAYFPSAGVLVYRPSTGGSDVATRFGTPGASIAAPGDYDGDGKTDIAVYLVNLGAFAVIPSNGTGAYLVQFGAAGAGNSIPAPGDYDGDGKTDFAVYIPSAGVLAYRPSSGGPDVLTRFGPTGPYASIPAPGDYDGDGKTDIALYLPSQGAFAIIPSNGSGAYIAPFGGAGVAASIPAPGDYDGDGKTDLSVYLTSAGFYAYRPSGGGSDKIQAFGPAGVGQSVPAPSIPYAFGPIASASAVRGQAASAGYLVALDVDLLSPTLGTKKRTT